jgi:hypothetical protein
MKVFTETGSIYEINADSKQIRRLEGKLAPMPRIGKDGEWRTFKELLPDPVQIGSNLIIVWGDDVKPMTEAGGIPTTMTSYIVSIEE